MLQQKQGARVRISSHEKVINMSEEYFPSDSKCSCFQCDSIACFKIRNINSQIPCTCTYCNPNTCLTWDYKNYESKSNNEMENIKVSSEISENLLNVSETKSITNTSDTNKYTDHPINTTKATRKISFSYLDNDLQKESSDDHELKEVYSIEKKHAEKCCNMKNFNDDKNIDELEIKDSSSNENSDIMEFDVSHSEKSHSNDTETNQVSKCDSDIKKIEKQNCYDHERNQSLKSNDINKKHLSSKICKDLPRNKTAQPETKELFTSKARKCCSRNITTDNTKSDFPKVYQIFTNEKKNIVKCCIVNRELEKKYIDTSVNKNDNPENRTKGLKTNFKETKVLQSDKLGTTEPNLEIKTKSKITNITCNHEHPIKDNTANIDSGNYTKYTYEDISHTKNKMNTNKNIKSYEKYVSRLQSVAISYGREDYENSRAELSAQIMNVPYEKFKESLSRKQSAVDSNYNSSTKLEKMDIFSRLKEIYKACSCKVCECIAGKSIFNRPEVCKCQPCDCNDCNGYMAKLRKRIISTPHSGCPCVSCDRKDCRGVVKSTSNYAACDCKPCDCLRCAESFTKPCTCTPCQCETCKTSILMPQTLLVANAAQSFRQSNCDCEPCECANCTSRCSAMTSNLMREVSTGIIAYGNCNCEKCSHNTCQLGRSDCRCNSQHKVTKKPMSEKSSDYGIHRVNIKQNKYQKKSVTNNNRNTIAMFALSNNYPNRLFNYSDKKEGCECDVCECIVCKNKGKASVTNKSLEIENQVYDFNTNLLNSCKCSPCACQSCKSLDHVDGKLVVKTGYDTHNVTNSKHLGHNFTQDNNENYSSKTKPKTSEFENKCNIQNCFECKNVVNLNSQYSTDTDEGFSQDNEKCFLLKKGKLLTPSMFEKNDVRSDSLIHIKPEKESLRENYSWKKELIKEQNSKLSCSKSHHNLDSDYNQDIAFRIQAPESAIKLMSTNSSLMNMVTKEVGSNEIYKTNSVDFRNGSVSKIFCEHSKANVQNDSNSILLDSNLNYMTAKPSCQNLNKKLEYNKEINQSSKTAVDRQEAEDFFLKTNSSNDVHFSSAESMSLVKLLCRERSLDIDNKYTTKFWQSLEKIPLKKLKMYDEKIYSRDQTLNHGIFFDSSTKKNCNYSLDNNSPINMDQDTLETYNRQNQKLDLTDKKIDKCDDINDNNTIKPSVSKTTKKIKSKAISNLEMVERKPYKYNYNIKAKGSTAQSKVNKPSRAKVQNNNLRSRTEFLKGNVNKINNKRYLEIPDVIDTATSSINFNISDTLIDFEQSSKLLRELDFNIGKNKKASPILRKNFFIGPEISKNQGMRSIPMLKLDIKSTVKSVSIQTSTISSYCPDIAFGNKALAKLQTEVNDLLLSPLLQSSFTNSHMEKCRSKNILNLELKSNMSNATSQTKRKNIAVDKEMNCNMLQSRENLKQSIQNLMNMTLTNVVQRTDMKATKLNLLRDFNKTTKSSYDGLKASFVGLRKVSDHSVLLRWTMPPDLSHIQGYELQVDGRPVQKILNPSRCMAVLTCLPHCEKLLLAIRTITNLETCYNPVTTVVYYPKKNKSGV